jgi:hypothetical protein
MSGALPPALKLATVANTSGAPLPFEQNDDLLQSGEKKRIGRVRQQPKNHEQPGDQDGVGQPRHVGKIAGVHFEIVDKATDEVFAVGFGALFAVELGHFRFATGRQDRAAAAVGRFVREAQASSLVSNEGRDVVVDTEVSESDNQEKKTHAKQLYFSSGRGGEQCWARHVRD